VVVAVDHGSQLGQDGVIRRNVGRRSVLDRSRESMVGKHNIQWNGQGMKEVELSIPAERLSIGLIGTLTS
jgi:hypothetical protein